MARHTKNDLKQMQSLPLAAKKIMSKQRIKVWFESWKRYEICGGKKTRFITALEEPTLKEGEYILSEHDGQVYVAFSGGKDSTVLSDLCAQVCQEYGWKLYLVFVNTGLEYPEIQKFVNIYAQYLRDKYDIEVDLEILRPKMRFDEIIKVYGYPIISKEVAKTVSAARRLDSKFGKVCLEKLNGTHTMKDGSISLFNCTKYKPLLDIDCMISDQCCYVMKKNPSHDYANKTGRKAITAQMADESRLRTQQWLENGCNAFQSHTPVSNPMSFWTKQDILWYIKEESLPTSSVYGDIVFAEDPEQIRIEDYGIDCGSRDTLCTTGCDRTGCIFCAFGAHLEKGESRFERLKRTHPRQYEYCIGGGEYDESGTWKPNKQGLGMGHVFDELNKIYGEGFIRYGKG